MRAHPIWVGFTFLFGRLYFLVPVDRGSGSKTGGNCTFALHVYPFAELRGRIPLPNTFAMLYDDDNDVVCRNHTVDQRPCLYLVAIDSGLFLSGIDLGPSAAQEGAV